MENEKLVLISKNEDQAQSKIENLKLQAKQTTDLIKYFNSIKLLNEITTEKELISFLKNPISYFHKRIMFDIKFSSKIAPPPEGVAQLYKLPYDEIVQVLGGCQVTDLSNMVFDEESQAILFDESRTEEIMEAFYEFAKDKLESDEIAKIRKIAQALNELAERFGIGSSNLNLAGNNLRFLKTQIKESGQGWELCVNISHLRDRLEYEKMHDL